MIEFEKVALGGLEIVADPYIPAGHYLIDKINHKIRVHPDSMANFLNLLRMDFEDPEGHKAFSE